MELPLEKWKKCRKCEYVYEDEAAFYCDRQESCVLDSVQSGIKGEAEPIASRCVKTNDRHLFSRLKSERELETLLDWEFETGSAYHVISGGDIDSLSFLKFILRQQPLEYCLLSTWCMAMHSKYRACQVVQGVF